MSNRKFLSKKESINKALNWSDGELLRIVESGKSAYIEIGIHDPGSSSQREKYHAMIGDVVKHAVIKIPGKRIVMSDYGLDIGKDLLVRWFSEEKKLMGEPLKKPNRTIIDPMYGDTLVVRASTRDFVVREAGDFIEWLYALGSDCKVPWSEPAMKEWQSYREAQS